ncbi:hypothetical protein CV102_13155 [Natronococcus pandeyae]|uniref:Uncharacterized protein n=1 Tax=Natronococcus pandeyae TaxID=2055836 RepID=A0A8J8Q445_9EURY|nr:hypothetical protein CV102_13155 [Natronococcus pandeyae]
MSAIHGDSRDDAVDLRGGVLEQSPRLLEITFVGDEKRTTFENASSTTANGTSWQIANDSRAKRGR